MCQTLAQAMETQWYTRQNSCPYRVYLLVENMDNKQVNKRILKIITDNGNYSEGINRAQVRFSLSPKGWENQWKPMRRMFLAGRKQVQSRSIKELGKDRGTYRQAGHCPGGLVNEESACKSGELGLIPGLGRSSGEGNGYPLQYSCLENSIDRVAWWATVHEVTKSWTQLSDWCLNTSPGSVNDACRIWDKIKGWTEKLKVCKSW